MKKIVLYSVATCLVLLVFLIAKLPAAQLAYRIKLPSNIQLGKVSGSIWQGRVDKLLVNGFYLEDLRWQLAALPLFVGKLSVDIKGGNPRDKDAIAISGPITSSLFNFKHYTAKKFTAYLPADKIIAKVKFPIRVNMGGRFRLKLDELAFGPTCETLNGKGEWINASIEFSRGPTNLGSYVADLACNGDAIQATVNEPNLLGLSFDSTVSADFKQFEISGKFKPDDSLPDEIKQAGSFFGSPESDGYTRFKL